jgi:hypothetical protein
MSKTPFVPGIGRNSAAVTALTNAFLCAAYTLWSELSHVRAEGCHGLRLLWAFCSLPHPLLDISERIGERLKRMGLGFWFDVFCWRHVLECGVLHCVEE